MSQVRFYFDFISPYAYVAWKQIHPIAVRHGAEVVAIPVLFAALLDAHGTLGPAEVPAKRVYTFKDAYRKAHHAGLPPLVPPPAHPFNPLVALRVATLTADDAALQRTVIDTLYDAAWAGARGAQAIDTDESVVSVLDAAGLDGKGLTLRASSPEIKAKLRAQTEDAIARGAFGVPTVVIDGEIFWGTDSLEHVEIFLRGEDPIRRAHGTDLAWAERPAAAERPRSSRRSTD